MVPTQIDSESCGLCLIMVSLGDNIDRKNSLLLLTKYIYLQSINTLLLDREITFSTVCEIQNSEIQNSNPEGQY